MFRIDSVDQRGILGQIMILGFKLTDHELLPKNSYTNNRGVRTPAKVQLIKLFRKHSGASLKDSKDIIELVLGEVEFQVRMLVSTNRLPEFIGEFGKVGIEIRCLTIDNDNRPEYQDALIGMIPQLPQRQDSLSDQLEDLVLVAKKLGMHDAADVIFDNLLRRR